MRLCDGRRRRRVQLRKRRRRDFDRRDSPPLLDRDLDLVLRSHRRLCSFLWRSQLRLGRDKRFEESASRPHQRERARTKGKLASIPSQVRRRDALSRNHSQTLSYERRSRSACRIGTRRDRTEHSRRRRSRPPRREWLCCDSS